MCLMVHQVNLNYQILYIYSYWFNFRLGFMEFMKFVKFVEFVSMELVEFIKMDLKSLLVE